MLIKCKLYYVNIQVYKYKYTIYSEMQSDGNSFGGDVVLKSVNMASRGEDSILGKIYDNQIFSDLFYEDFTIRKWLKKMHI